MNHPGTSESSDPSEAPNRSGIRLREEFAYPPSEAAQRDERATARAVAIAFVAFGLGMFAGALLVALR